MGREKVGSREFKKSPTLDIRKSEGLYVKGKLLKKIESTMFPGALSYLIEVTDTNATPVMYDPNTKTNLEAELGAGEAAFVKGTTTLNRDMGQILEGERVEIVYEGVGKAAKGRRAPHLWSVYKITEE